MKLTAHIKVRTFATRGEDVWRDEWHNPQQVDLPVTDPVNFLQTLWNTSKSENVVYVDKLNTGFLTWAPTVKAYRRVGPGSSAFTWEARSQPALDAMRRVMTHESFFEQLATLSSQESSKNPSNLKLRPENTAFIKSLGRCFGNFGRIIHLISLLQRKCSSTSG